MALLISKKNWENGPVLLSATPGEEAQRIGGEEEGEKEEETEEARRKKKDIT